MDALIPPRGGVGTFIEVLVEPSDSPPVSTLTSLLGRVVASYQQYDMQLEESFKEAAAAWVAGEMKGEKPIKQPGKMNGLISTLSEVLGLGVVLRERPSRPMMNHFPLSFVRAGVPGDLQSLSDGERQILMLGTMLIESGSQTFVFLADEPELHLNDAKSIQLWERLEQAFPKAIFLYATHSAIFATRPSIEQLFVMDMNGSLDLLAKDETLPASIVRDMVGAQVQLLRPKGKPVFCEDTLTRLLLGDLFRDLAVELVALDGRDGVIAAVKGEMLWGKLRSSTAYCGVLDRDTIDDHGVTKLEQSGIFCLPVYDAESFLVVPEVASRILEINGNSNVDCTEILVECANRSLKHTLQLIGIAVCSDARPRMTFETQPKLIVNWHPPVDKRSEGQARAQELLDAIAEKKSDSILRLFKGKALYKAFKVVAKEQFDIVLPDAKQQYLALRATHGFPELIAKTTVLQVWKAKVSVHLNKI